jgi:DNA-directed RNA polymerase subunit RPC12/RpoP
MARHNADLVDLRSALSKSGDVMIGLYARQQRRRRILISLAGVALMGGALWLYVALRPQSVSEATGGFPVLVQCVEPDCGYRGVVRLTTERAVYPVMCPECGRRACRKVWECRTCGTQFLPTRTDGDIVCPACGSRAVGTAQSLNGEPDAVSPR